MSCKLRENVICFIFFLFLFFFFFFFFLFNFYCKEHSAKTPFTTNNNNSSLSSSNERIKKREMAKEPDWSNYFLKPSTISLNEYNYEWQIQSQTSNYKNLSPESEIWKSFIRKMKQKKVFPYCDLLERNEECKVSPRKVRGESVPDYASFKRLGNQSPGKLSVGRKDRKSLFETKERSTSIAIPDGGRNKEGSKEEAVFEGSRIIIGLKDKEVLLLLEKK